MTKRRLLSEMDSLELTEWQAFFPAKHEREEAARERANFERKIGA